jgi:hypothetical protein
MSNLLTRPVPVDNDDRVSRLHADSRNWRAAMLSVPAKPTEAMVAAGAAAGGVSVERAWRIYQAMLTAR